MSTTHITIRVPGEVKKELEKLAKLVNVNLSDLIRDIIIPLTKIATSIDTLQTIEKIEKAFIEVIVRTEEFQKLLKELTRFLRTRNLPIGYFGEKVEEYKVLKYDYSIKYKNGMYYPVKMVTFEDCNEYGTCWYTGYDYVEIETIKELSEFLNEAMQSVTEELEGKIESIKEAIKELLK